MKNSTSDLQALEWIHCLKSGFPFHRTKLLAVHKVWNDSLNHKNQNFYGTADVSLDSRCTNCSDSYMKK
jgi:hypothetical protein